MEDRAKSRSIDFERLNWSIVEKECPQQLNYVDCGVFISVYACFHSRNLPLDYNQDFVNDRRPEILLSIMDQKCHIQLNCNNLNTHLPDHIIKDFTLTEEHLKPGAGIITIISRCSELFGSKKRKKRKNPPKKIMSSTTSRAATTSQAATATTQKHEEISRQSLDPKLTSQVLANRRAATTPQAATATTQKHEEISRQSLDPKLTSQVLANRREKAKKGGILGEASSATATSQEATTQKREELLDSNFTARLVTATKEKKGAKLH